MAPCSQIMFWIFRLLLQRGGLADLSARAAEIQPCPLICGLGPFQVMTRASRGSCREIPPFTISQANTAGRIRSRFQPRDGGRGRGERYRNESSGGGGESGEAGKEPFIFMSPGWQKALIGAVAAAAAAAAATAAMSAASGSLACRSTPERNVLMQDWIEID